MNAVDWKRVYEIAKDLGIPLLTFVLGLVVEHTRAKRADREDAELRRHELEASEMKARDNRILRVIEAYMKGAQGARILGEDGALEAGVLELNDWTEVRDFCNRTTHRLSRQDDAPIPRGRRDQLRDEQLLAYFSAWRELKATKGQFNLAELFARCSELASPN